MFNLKLTLICLLNIVSLLCFLYGFFPLQSKISQYNSNSTDSFQLFHQDLSGICDEVDSWRISRTETPKQLVGNLVLIIIDALRYDFVFTSTDNPNGRMKFVNEMINSGHGLGYKATVQPPTVTMPRIKAITAGMVPAFADVILNFASPVFIEDNLVTKAKNSGRRLVFYGDDTWLRLFPDHFYDSDGVTSFIVTDYTEVDDNVTRHLPKAIESAGDWDVMILHYLGLDHIGHTGGPASPLISRKLAEMDEVIRKIYDGLKEKSRSFAIVALGDHGMTDVGSHGGSSQHETNVPIIFIGSNGMPGQGSHPAQTAQQVDLTPTLAHLLGLPTPVNSVGILLPSVFNHVTKGQFLEANLIDSLRQNAAGMLRLYRQNSAREEWMEVLERYTVITNDYRAWLEAEFCRKRDPGEDRSLALKDRYQHLMEEIRHRMIKSSITYNEWALIGGILAFCFVVLLSIRECYGLILDGLSNPGGSGRRCGFLILGCLLHMISFGSSSFIEEEHLTWYFLLETYLLLLLVDNMEICQRSKLDLSSAVGMLISACFPLVAIRLIRSWNRAGIKWRDLECLSDWLIRPENRFIHQLIVGVSALGLSIMAFQRARGILQRFLLLVGCALVGLYRLELCTSWNTAAVRMVYILCVFFVLNRQTLIGVVLVASVLVKLTNLPLLFVAVVIQNLTAHIAISSIESPLEVVCSSYYLATVMYFSLGNSNSLGHVDVSSGYVGLNAYSPVINGLLIIAHLYAGPLLVVASVPSDSSKSSSAKKGQVPYLILALKGVPAAFYLLIAYFQRYHLFVWSVFAPKLLYECLHVAVICTAVIFAQFYVK